jgi:hypothetical protein
VVGAKLSRRGGMDRSWTCKVMLAASGVLGRGERELSIMVGMNRS